MKSICIFLSSLCLSAMPSSHHINLANSYTGNYDQVRMTAIQDFSKTKLFKMDSIFYVTLYDTLHMVENQRIDNIHIKSVKGKAYPEIIAVNILASRFKYLFDTTASMDMQSKGIPRRVVEKNGKLFLWRDKNYPLTDSTLRILNKFHLVERGAKSDLYKFLIFGTDDSKHGVDYYFCRSDISIYKKKITNIAIGYYDPPNIKCK